MGSDPDGPVAGRMGSDPDGPVTGRMGSDPIEFGRERALGECRGPVLRSVLHRGDTPKGPIRPKDRYTPKMLRRLGLEEDALSGAFFRGLDDTFDEVVGYASHTF